MSIGALLTLACTITHAAPSGAADEYGDPTEQTFSSDTTCHLEQVAAREETSGRDTQTEDWRLFLPAETTIDGGDRVTVDGYGTFEALGPPWPVHNPRTRTVSHVECRARRVT